MQKKFGRPAYFLFFCSLYPTMAIKNKFPVGLGTVYIGAQIDEIELHPVKGFRKKKTKQKVAGLVQCAVIADSDLFLPVLVS